MVKTGLVEAFDSLVPLDKHLATFRGTDIKEKDEKRSQIDKTGLGMEKRGEDTVKSKPKCEKSQQQVNPKSTPKPKVKKNKFEG
ncbi:hypothetical protein Tco_0901190 [Tanacetum coccineum]